MLRRSPAAPRPRPGRSCSGSIIPIRPPANAQALHDLENGATGLELVFAGANGARGFGIVDADRGTLIAKLFDGVFIDAGIAIALNRSARNRGWPAIQPRRSTSKRKGVDPASLRYPLQPRSARYLRRARIEAPIPWSEIVPAVRPAVVKDLAARGFKGPFALADGRVIHDAGGSEAQELAFALALARRLSARAGRRRRRARHRRARHCLARLSADADQFLTMAKFRALRLLWARIEQACGLSPKPIFIAAETAWRMLTQRDPYVNMLRATMATFSAGLGGANAITVLPHTLALGLPDPFARRVARNTQLVLLEESNLAKVSDPGGRLRRHRGPDASSFARRHGRCFRRSRKPAACSPRSNKT